MKNKTLACSVLLLVSLTTSIASADVGPYPVIFLHGQKAEADPQIGWKTWNDVAGLSAMSKILYYQYGGYQAGTPSVDCDVNSNLTPTSDPRRIYNFSFYNPNASRGVIGDNHDTLYPVATIYNTRVDYQNSANNACWAEHLADFIDDVLQATGAPKVNLVCHSMGGLVARAAITYYGCENKVHKVLMIGTPNHGFGYGDFIETLLGINIKLLGMSISLTDWPTWQKHGEILEMGIHTGQNASNEFYNSDPQWVGWQSCWHSWLLWYDPGGQTEPLYGTVAGTRPDHGTEKHEGNDGVVQAKAVKLDKAVFNTILDKYHYKKDNKPSEECLPTCSDVERIIKQWLLDYHVPPSITYVDWIQIGKTSDPMGEGEIGLWRPHVFFRFQRTHDWGPKWYKGYCYDPHQEYVQYPYPPHTEWREWRLSRYWTNYIERDFVDNKYPYYVDGELGRWYVEACLGNFKTPTYDTVLVSEIYEEEAPELPDPGGCPDVYTFYDTDTSTGEYLFAENNTILPNSEHQETALDTVDDCMVLSSPLRSQNSRYYLKIIENSNAVTYLDEARLYAVDHSVQTQVAASPDNNLYVYSEELMANYCYTLRSEMVEVEDSTGEPTGEFVEYTYPVDHLDEIQYFDGSIFVAADAESVFVSFPPLPDGWDNVGLLVSVGDGWGVPPDSATRISCMSTIPAEPIKFEPIKLYKWKISQVVDSITAIPLNPPVLPRYKPSSSIAPISAPGAMGMMNAAGGDEVLTFKLVCSAQTYAYIDRIALVKLETSGWTVTEAPLDSIVFWHDLAPHAVPVWVFTNPEMPNPYLLGSGDQISLSYAAIPQDTTDTTMTRSFIFKTHGFYYYGASRSPDDLEEQGQLPKQYDLYLEQIASASRTVDIFYALPAAGRVTMEVFDVTGRRVAVLVDERLEAGSYTLNWDASHTNGQKLATGVYFIRMAADKFAKSTKLVIVD